MAEHQQDSEADRPAPSSEVDGLPSESGPPVGPDPSPRRRTSSLRARLPLGRGHRPSPRGRWLRLLSILVLVVIVTAAYVLTRPTVLRSLLEPTLSRAFGGTVALADVRLDGLSTVSVGTLTLHAPGWTGEAAEVVRAEGTRVTVSLAALLTGSIDVRQLQFDRLRVRCAEREDAPGEFNLLALQTESRDEESRLRLMRVDLGRLDIETGTVDRAGNWTLIGERSLRGFLSPSPDRAGGSLYSFRLADIAAPPSTKPEASGELAITGTWDERSFALDASLEAIAIDDRMLALLPQAAQRSARTLGLTGEIRGAQVRWSPKKPIFAELAVADMSVTLPEGLDLDDDWSRFRNGKREPRANLPTIHVRDGSVRLEGRNVTLHRLVGELSSSETAPAPTATGAAPSSPPAAPGVVPVPIELTLALSLADLPQLSAEGELDWNDAEARRRWISEALSVVPFRLTVGIKGFDSSKAAQGEEPVLEVPTPIAAALETFGVTAWRLDVEAEFSRAAPTRGEIGAPGLTPSGLLPAPIRSKGQCFLSGGRGSYEGFPYEISDVRAHIAFDQDESGVDRLTIDYVNATTEAGSTITMKGTVSDLGPKAVADITVTAPNFTIDSRLIELFDQGKHTSISCIFHRPSFEGLDRAGLIPSDDRADLSERAKSLEASLAALEEENTAERTRLTSELARVRRMIDVHPFVMGGTGALSVRLIRSPSADPPVSVAGSVTIDRAGILIDEFPYPLVVTSGTITIAPGQISFGDEGLRAITPEGGLVRLGGTIALVEREVAPGRTSADSVRGRPNLTLTGAGDRVSPLLLAAIPPDRGEVVEGWPGEGLAATAALLDSTGLQGTIDLFGTIAEEDPPEGVPLGRKMPTHTRLQIEVSDGSLDSKLAPHVRQSLPAGISLRDLTASVIVDRGLVEFRSLKAVDAGGSGRVSASGRFNSSDADERVEVELDDMPLAPWLAEAFPDEAVEQARSWWQRWNPRGVFDAHVTVSSAPDGGTRTAIEAHPTLVTVAPFGRDVSVRGLGGSISILADEHGTHGTVKDLQLSDGLEANAGQFTLDATIEAHEADVEAFDVRVRSDDLRFESAINELLLRWADANELADAVVARAPSGRTKADLRLGLAKPQSGDPSARSGSFDWTMRLEPATLALSITSGAVTARPAITFDAGAALEASNDGARFSKLGGSFEGGRVMADGAIDLRAPLHVAEGTYSLEAERWSDALSVLLPPPLNVARDEIELRAERLALTNATIKLTWEEARGIGSPQHYSLDGALTLGQAKIAVGVPFTELDGQVDFGFLYEPDAQRTELRANVTLPTCRLYDRLLTDGSTGIRLSDPTEGTERRLLIENIAGTVADGRVVGNAWFGLESSRYALDVRVIEASLAPLIAPRDPESASGGIVDARLALEGRAAEAAAPQAEAPPPERTGRGRILIRDASMAKSPITMRLLQLSQLALPLSSALKTGDIQFYVDGERATFDKFELTTDGLVLDGSGTLFTRDFVVDLRFRSRGKLGILSEIVGTVSDQLYEITVTGPLNDPQAGILTLPGLRSPRDSATVEAK
jgi:hypothetical protein